MKNLFLLIIWFLSICNISAQTFIPNKLIVSANKLYFREGPGTKYNTIDFLKNGEIVSLIKYIPLDEPSYKFDGNYDQLWLKIKRISTGDIGYAFGKFLKPINIGFLKEQDCERIPPLNWYGIQQINNKDFEIKKTQPYIKKDVYLNDAGIVDNKNSLFIIGLHDKIKTGEINGRTFGKFLTKIKIGDDINIFESNKGQFLLQISGEYKQNNGRLIRIKENLHFVHVNELGETNSQTLTDQFDHFGIFGFDIHFVGDINGNGYPDMIISETNGKKMAVYFFMSTDAGKIELQSITWQGPGC